MLIASLSLVIGGVVVARIGWKSRSGGLPRNTVAGLRTKATMASDEAWYAAQRRGAPFVVAAGIACAIGGVASVPFSGDEPVAAAIVLGTAGLVLALVVWGGILGQKAARAVG